MTVTVGMSAAQAAPGAPINIAATYAENTSSDSTDWVCVGVKVASGAVSRFDELAHVDGLPEGGLTSAYWDTASEAFSQSTGASVNTQYVDRYSYTRLQRVDSNYAAGRFLWFLSFGSGSPAAGDAPTHAAGPYTIR